MVTVEMRRCTVQTFRYVVLRMRMQRFLGISALVVLAALLASCGFSENKVDAERLVDHYFEVVAGPDVAAALSLYSPQFFEVTPRDNWANTLKQIRDRCGTPKSHTLKTWSVNSRFGTNGGSSATLVYDVEYTQCHMSETITTFRPDGGERKIIGHYFKADDLRPNRTDKTTTT